MRAAGASSRLSFLLAVAGALAARAQEGSPAGPKGAPPGAASTPAPALFAQRVGPFLRRYCLECHDAKQAEGDLVLEGVGGQDDVLASPRLWRRVRRELVEDTMPPEEARRHPPREEALAVAAWIDAVLAGPSRGPVDPGRVTLRRLNRYEYDNTVRDLFGVTSRPARRFPEDPTGYGFDTASDVLSVSPLFLERALAAAEEVAEAAILVYRPLERRVQAERMLKTARGRNHGGWANFSTNGRATVSVRVEHPGSYRFRARACGDQAGGAPCRMAFWVDGRAVAQVNVPAPRSAPAVYERTVSLSAGEHEVGVAFTNDWWRPKNPAGDRDRNLAVDWVELVGPLDPPRLPPFQRRFVVPAGTNPRPPVRALLERAFRRPPRADDVERYLGLYREARAGGVGHLEALRAVVTAALVSPRFLFRVELDPAPGAAARLLDEWELATRLSYFLWASTPDDRLLELARRGELRARLDEELVRLLDDPRASALVEGFASQWLELRRLVEADPDPQRFPGFSERLRADMRTESELFFEAVLRENRSVLDLLRARFTFVNERLARHYGIEGVRGERFRRVLLPPGRTGILTHASILTLTSNATRTSPVKRGKWVLEALLDDPPGAPPPGAGSLPATPPGAASRSVRELLAAHRRNPDCAACHARMDPIGLALEGFDAIGRQRNREAGRPIDRSGELPGGRRFVGAAGLRDDILAHRREDFVRCVAAKLFVYALGRGLRPADEVPLRALVRGVAPRYRFQDLVKGIVRLDAFQKRGAAR
ncbi:MAG: DUF1592 domain-containing protein [Planctomycetota bacterium]|nr:MAG: DUF1592 domain-containing protein [Planctomycetota bacterium]